MGAGVEDTFGQVTLVQGSAIQSFPEMKEEARTIDSQK